MPRKTAADLRPHSYASGRLFPDTDACVRSYSWLVKDARKDARLMYEMGTEHHLAYYCKVCGGSVRRADTKLHVQEHAQQLGLLN